MHKILGTTIALFTAVILFTDQALASSVFKGAAAILGLI
jgi:hypothetical protein